MLKLVCINAGLIVEIIETESSSVELTHRGKDLKEFEIYTAPDKIGTNKYGQPTYFINELNCYKLCQRFEIIDKFKENTVNHLDQLINQEYKQLL